MISTIQIRCNAAHPEMPLQPMIAFKSSPSSVRITDIPKRIGEWTITEVVVSVKYPDNSISTKNCVRVGNVWIATMDECQISGKTANGFIIGANGINENGDEVNGYVLGVGDVMILDGDTQFHPDMRTYYIRVLDEQPESPNVGDSYFDNGILKLYDGSVWQVVTGLKDGINDIANPIAVTRSNSSLSTIIDNSYIKINQGGQEQNQNVLDYDSIEIGPIRGRLDVGPGIRISSSKVSETENWSYITIDGTRVVTSSDVQQYAMPIDGKTAGDFRLGTDGSCAEWSSRYKYLGLKGDGYSLWMDTGTMVELEDGWDQLKKVVSAGREVIYQTLPEYLSSNYATSSDIHDSRITIYQGGIEKGSFTLNQSTSANISVDAGLTTAQVQQMIDSSIGNVLQEAF